MKRFLFVITLGLCLSQPLLAYESPGKPSGFVSDFAGVLSSDERAYLEDKIGNFERPAGVELAVVTVSSLGGETIENYAARLFEEWGIGKARSDNGLLFLVAPSDREARIEVGYGMEPVVTDAASSIIMRNVIVPRFAAGNYFDGIDAGVDALVAVIEGDPDFLQFVADQQAVDEAEAQAGKREAVIFWILIVVVLIVLSKVRGADPHGPGGSGFWTRAIFGGMGGRGGGGRGGFGGFGGGRSGGGGSSGRW